MAEARAQDEDGRWRWVLTVADALALADSALAVANRGMPGSALGKRIHRARRAVGRARATELDERERADAYWRAFEAAKTRLDSGGSE